MRMLRAWLSRERTVRGAADIALDVAERQVSREERIGARVCVEAHEIDRRAEQARVCLTAALTDTQSPGVIDALEVKAVTVAILGVGIAAHEHNKTTGYLA